MQRPSKQGSDDSRALSLSRQTGFSGARNHHHPICKIHKPSFSGRKSKKRDKTVPARERTALEVDSLHSAFLPPSLSRARPEKRKRTQIQTVFLPPAKCTCTPLKLLADCCSPGSKAVERETLRVYFVNNANALKKKSNVPCMRAVVSVREEM